MYGRVVAGLAGILLVASTSGCSLGSSSSAATSSRSSSGASTQSAAPTPTASTSNTPPASRMASDLTTMVETKTIGGAITPKSVVTSGHGLAVANNMMYSHSATFYDTRTGTLAATVADDVDLSAFGFPEFPGRTKGAPVEAAWSPDGRYAYVSNYAMSGPNHRDSAQDFCGPENGYVDSFVYRIDTQKSFAVDQVIRVGAVPKYLTVTPDGRTLLVNNWCSWTMSVIDLATGRQVKQIPLPKNPRGMVVLPDSKTAYVAAFSTPNIYRVDLDAGTCTLFAHVGQAARHITMSPDAKFLYVVSSRANHVTKVDRDTGVVLATTPTEREPRTMAISPDGKALYVVDHWANVAQKIRTSDMRVIQTVKTFANPIGVSYDSVTGTVWIANYSGRIQVFDDTSPAAATSSAAPDATN